MAKLHIGNFITRDELLNASFALPDFATVPLGTVRNYDTIFFRTVLVRYDIFHIKGTVRNYGTKNYRGTSTKKNIVPYRTATLGNKQAWTHMLNG